MSYEPNPTSASLNSPPAAATFGNVPQPAEGFGRVPHSAESFGTVPNHAEDFRTVPKTSETFRIVPQPAVRRENCTLTVREVARLFETAGVARSERSITNWCQPNRQGIARLEAYFDPNERRYFITPRSVDAVIAEEKAKAAKANAELPHGAEEFRNPATQPEESLRTIPNTTGARPDAGSGHDIVELRKEMTDLKITNRGKDYFIEQMRSERESLLKQLVDSSQRNGQLEAKLLQLAAPNGETDRTRSASIGEATFSR